MIYDLKWLSENYTKYFADDESVELIKKLIEINNEFDENKNNYYVNYINTWMNQLNGFNNVFSKKVRVIKKEDEESFDFGDDFLKLIQNYIDSFESLSSLDILKKTDTNVVMVGANGSGKTTFLKYLISKNSNIGISYFPSERLYISDNRTSYPMTFERFMKDYDSNKQQIRRFDLNGRASYFSQDFNYTMALLVKKYNNELQLGVANKDTITMKIINKWNDLIVNRKLIIQDNQIFGVHNDENYSIDKLSAGEKAILYFLTSILVLEPANYYFIDEPENSLNSSVVSQLWTFIESEMTESIFVYLTHDSNFVSSRNRADKYWMKQYNGFQKWDIVKLPYSDSLPEDLIVELVGSKQPVLFVESENSSKYDAKFYTLMYPEFKVIPSGGCDQVKFKTKGFNNLGLRKAFGIIDCDYYTDEELNGQTKHNIHHVPFFEIENFLVSEKIVKSVIKYHKHGENLEEVFQTVHDKLTEVFKNSKEKIITNMTIHLVKTHFKNVPFSNNIKLSALKTYVEDFSDTDVHKIYADNEKLINLVIARNNYNEMLRYLDMKGSIMRIIGPLTGLQKYGENILSYLQYRDNDLLGELRSEYLKDIFE